VLCVETGFGGNVAQLYDLIAERKETRPKAATPRELFEEGIDKIVKKLGEEALKR
jgi:phosphoribosyl-ATP pyrophosphohydrolase